MTDAGEDFFLEDDDPTTTLKQLSKRRRPVKESAQRSKRMKVGDEEEEDDLDRTVGFDYSSDEAGAPSSDEEEEEEKETAAEKRLRLAQRYLKKLSQQEEGAKINDAGLSSKLQDEALEAQGRLVKEVASQITTRADNAPKVVRVLRGHQLPPTCVAVTEDGSKAFSGSKDCSIIQWDMETGSKLITRGGRRSNPKKTHTGQVLTVDVTSDNKFLASAGRDKIIRIWDTRSNEIVHSFSGHKGAITGLKFRKDSYQLFSASEDRSIKTWNLDPMMYTESLYGHQSEVMGIDSLYKERAVSCGVDRTCRIWKIVEESQLLYRGHTAAIDCISLINEETYVTGSQDGSIGLWNAGHKKPNFVFARAHGKENPWISSVCALPFTDLVLSGSHDGHLNFWQFSKQKQTLGRIHQLPMAGFINGIAAPKSGKFLAVAVGQEHRLGRWWRNTDTRNSVQIVSMPIEK